MFSNLTGLLKKCTILENYLHQKMLFFIQIMFIVKIVMFKEIPLRKCIVPLYTNIKTGTCRLSG